MVFWIAILVGGVFAWLGVKRGFYETLIILFNVVISIYLAIFLSPMTVTISGLGSYGNVINIVIAAIVCFSILHGISWLLFIGQFNVPFPKLLDVVGAGVVGFLTGLLVWSFVSFLVCITPVSQNTFVKEMGFKQNSTPYLSWWCDLINNAASCEGEECTTEEVISWLLQSAAGKTLEKGLDPNEPTGSIESGEVEADEVGFLPIGEGLGAELFMGQFSS